MGVFRFSPNYSLAPTYDGHVLFVEEAHPYRSLRVEEEIGMLATLFLGANGTARDAALRAFADRLSSPTSKVEERFSRGFERLATAGVLIEVGTELSIYTADVASSYAAERVIPAEIGRCIAKLASISKPTRVLDLATGTGSLAIALARYSRRVQAMDISRGFLSMARREAVKRRVRVDWRQESVNRLQFYDERYDVVTIAQALDWIDPIALGRGLYRVLDPDGWFFCVSTWIDFPEAHPLHAIYPERFANAAALETAFQSGHAKIAGALERGAWGPAANGAQIVPVGQWAFRQPRQFGERFARAYFTDWHIARVNAPGAWRKALAALSRKGAVTTGTAYWWLAAFRRQEPLMSRLTPA